MRFQINDAVDAALTATMVHELFLCSERLTDFRRLELVDAGMAQKKYWKIKRHDAYSQFIHHLYEFWVAAAMRDAKSTKSLRSDVLDELLTFEAKKAIMNRRQAVEHLKPLGWEVSVERFKDIDDDFGKHFRLVRNRTAHASHRRAQSNLGDLTLGEFFIRFHHVVTILFETARFAWTVHDIESFEWLEIEAFGAAVSERL